MEVSKERNSLTTVAKKNVSKSYVGHCSRTKGDKTSIPNKGSTFCLLYDSSRGKFCEISATTAALAAAKDGNLPHLRGDFR